MSGRKRKEFWLSQPADDQGSRPISAHSSGRSTPDLRLRSHRGSQPTVNPHSGDQPAPNPSSNEEPTPKRRRIATERILEPTASGQRAPVSGQLIDDGIYTITNVRHNRFVYLEDPNDNTPLRGHYNPENRSTQWYVRSWGNDEYTIRNVDHTRYAYCGAGARLKASVEGHSSERLWLIQAHSTGEYTIATTDTGNLWMLPYSDPDTPVELFNVHTDRRCWWTFKKQEIGNSAKAGHHNPDIYSRHPRSSGQGTLDPHSTSQQSPDLYLDLISAINESTDLLKPLNATCGALKAALQAVKDIDQVHEDREGLIRTLGFHLATIENHLAKLEEDADIDGTIPGLDQAVKEPLETYARELEEIYKLLLDNQPGHSPLANEVNAVDHTEGLIADKTRDVDEAFQRYTVALHLFAVNTFSRMQPEFHGEFLQEAKKQNFNQLKVSNAYGVQHVSCIPGTRLKTLQAIRDWVDDESTTKPIFFLLDVAGSGKSTVAKNMAVEWAGQKRLLARFFFSRDTTETMSTNSFCSTVAGAFADLDPDFKLHMNEFQKRANVGLLPFEEQFEGLVVRPLRAIRQHAILIIDALDECNAKQRDELLETLLTQHSSILLLRILVTGRPEHDIKCWAEEKFGFGYMNFTRLEGGDKDVELYINSRLQTLSIVQDRLYPVIQHAEGLFIWARVACDLLVDSVDIDGLLEELGKEVSLDHLYKVALEQSMPKEGASRRAMGLVLQMILAAREPLSIVELEMLSPKPGVVEKVVTRLGSVLLYQGREDPIRLLHATFREFLTARSKADIFFIQPELGHHTLASGCLNVISHVLKQDEATLRNPDAIFDKKAISLLARSLLTVFLGLLFTRQTHGSIIVHLRIENWL